MYGEEHAQHQEVIEDHQKVDVVVQEREVDYGSRQELTDAALCEPPGHQSDSSNVAEYRCKEEDEQHGHPDGTDVPFSHRLRHLEDSLRLGLDELDLVVGGEVPVDVHHPFHGRLF